MGSRAGSAGADGEGASVAGTGACAAAEAACEEGEAALESGDRAAAERCFTLALRLVEGGSGAAAEGPPVAPVATGTGAEGGVDAYGEAGTEAHVGTLTDTDTSTGTGTEAATRAQPGTRADADSGTGTEPGAQPGAGAGAETAPQPNTGTDTQSDTDTDPRAQPSARADAEAEVQPIVGGGLAGGPEVAARAVVGARARIGLGRVRLAEGGVGQALEEFRRARAADPGGSGALYWAGCALARGGDLAAADEHLTQALDHPRAIVQRAYVRAKSGRYDAALDDLRTAERDGVLDHEGRWLLDALGGRARDTALRLRKAALAALAGDVPDWERAAALLAASWRLARHRGAFVPLYATALAAGGHRDVAVDLLDDATRHDPSDHRVTHTLAVALTNSPSRSDGCVGAWGALLYADAFWERARRGAGRRYGTEVAATLVPVLRTALRDRLARFLAEGADTDARVPPDALLHREAEAARVLAEAGGLPRPAGELSAAPGGTPVLGGAPLLGGPLRVVALGRVREFGAFAAARPGDLELVHCFSELGFARMQVDQGLPGDALAALTELRCPECRARGRAVAVCEADCARFDELNPGYAGFPDRRDRLARDARDLALHARIALGNDELVSPCPDFAAVATCWRRALVHSRELARYRPTQARIVGLALAAAKDASRARNLTRAVTTLETARSVIGANERPRIDGQLARVLAHRGIEEANREDPDPDLDAAAEDLRRSVALSPHVQRTQISLGIVLRGLALRRWGSGSLSGARTALEEAVEALTAALAHFPEDPEIEEERRRAQSELDFVREQFDESGR
ncbi:hypothetical protein [Streptomyces sp. NPDC059063]|uniref:hypothetical protein n=1 Tax=unclassified Streptomyces TaxID=2593676 RepID=UPI0036A56823